MKKFIGAIVCACFLMVLTSSAHAINYEEWVDSVVTAADAMVAAQNDDGTFDWIQDGDSAVGGAVNTQGATGRGLVAAYNVTGNTTYLDAANNAADWLNNNSSSLYNKDIEFLYELAAAGGNDYTGFASNQAISKVTDYVDTFGGVYERYLALDWESPENTMDGAKLWMIGEWGHVGQLLGDTEIFTGYTGFDLASEIGTKVNNFYPSYNPDTDPADYGTLGLVGILEGMYFGGGGYSNEEDALDDLWSRSTTERGWQGDVPTGEDQWQDVQDTAYKTYTLSLYGINEPDELTNWINAGDFNPSAVDARVEYAGEALLGVANAPVPEPATMLLFGVGLLGIAGVSRRKRA